MTRVVVDSLGIPKRILFNRVRGFGQVHQTYKSVLYTEYFKRLHQSFADRAFWGTDEAGNSWAELEILTDIIKQEEMETGVPYNTLKNKYTKNRDGVTYADEKKKKIIALNLPQMAEDHPNAKITKKEYLAPEVTPFNRTKKAKEFFSTNQLEIYRQRMEASKNALNPKSIRQRARDALKNMPKIDGGDRGTNWNYKNQRVQRTPINIRSGRLFAAFFPGEVANTRIYGGPDQTFELRGLSVHFNVKRVPYSKDCEKETPKGVVRILIPESHFPGGPVFMECHWIAIKAARAVYDRLLANNTKQQERSPNDREHPPAPRRRSR